MNGESPVHDGDGHQEAEAQETLSAHRILFLLFSEEIFTNVEHDRGACETSSQLSE